MINSIFTAIQKEFYIPTFKTTVFVSDFFLGEVTGGAELTLQALMEAVPCSPKLCSKIHSSSLTVEMIKSAPKNILWVFGNFSQLDPTVAEWISDGRNEVIYVATEMDFKFCSYRSPNLHAERTKSPCECAKSEKGRMIAKFFMGARLIAWMSQAQKLKYQTLFPDIMSGEDFEKKSMVVSSVFSKVSLDALDLLYTNRAAGNFVKDQYAVLGSASWIKGTEDAIAWCKANNKKPKLLHGLSPIAFLEELAKCEGFVFLPRDNDTCPRVTIEAKILGLKLEINDHVMQKSEPWFQTAETAKTYLRTSAQEFWSRVQQSL